jgi:hypothetical protein
MAEDTGKGAYGTRHVMEEEMRAAGQGVFEGKSAGSAPSNKALSGAEEDKDALPSLSGMTKDQLSRQAAIEGVQIETDDNKADIVRKIEEARA